MNPVAVVMFWDVVVRSWLCGVWMERFDILLFVLIRFCFVLLLCGFWFCMCYSSSDLVLFVCCSDSNSVLCVVYVHENLMFFMFICFFGFLVVWFWIVKKKMEIRVFGIVVAAAATVFLGQCVCLNQWLDNL